MSRIVRPTTFFMNGTIVCPDDGWTRWQSGRCAHCRARLIGPRHRPSYIDGTVRTWLISEDGHAELVAPGLAGLDLDIAPLMPDPEPDPPLEDGDGEPDSVPPDVAFARYLAEARGGMWSKLDERRDEAPA